MASIAITIFTLFHATQEPLSELRPNGSVKGRRTAIKNGNEDASRCVKIKISLPFLCWSPLVIWFGRKERVARANVE